MPEKYYPINLVEEYALSFLRKGREGFDIPHTKTVVYYAEQIAIAQGFDVQVFKTAAWLHDIGYFGLFNSTVESDNFEKIGERKAFHMINGGKIARGFLNSPEITEFYNPEQKDKIIFLVENHDKLDELSTLEQYAFMEADTLGAIDLSRLKPTYDKVNALKYIKNDLAKRIELFKTEYGKRVLEELLPGYIKYCEEELK
jgi:putative nucleotidyltransferase with HDIG domain